MKQLLSLLLLVVTTVVPETTAAAVEPLHGPWLINPAPDRITVCWESTDPSGAGVEFREAGQKTRREAWETVGGQIRTDRRMHRVELTGLKAGAVYEYRLLAATPGSLDVDREPEFRRFTAFDPEKKKTTALLTSDIHGRPKELAALLRSGNVANADFVVLLGDSTSALESASRDIYGGYLDEYVRLTGGLKPLIMVRGNHEWRGRDAIRWFDFFAAPDGLAFQAFRHGPVLYVVLDSGEDKPDGSPRAAYTYLNRSPEWMARQRRWLQQLTQSQEFRTAPFRVVLTHIPTHGQAEGHGPQTMRRYFGDLLNSDAPDQRIHLMIAGHEHRYMRVDAGSEEFKGNPLNLDGQKRRGVTGRDFHYTLISNDGPGFGGSEYSIIRLSASAERLSVSVMDEQGKCLDAFSITPDGRVRDDIKVAAFRH